MTPKPEEPVLPDDPGASKAPSAPAPAPSPLDLEESVAGEEDPGASLDLGVEETKPAKPERE